MFRDLVLDAYRDLRQRRLLISYRIAQQAEFGTEHVLTKAEPAAKPERGPRRPCVEPLIGVGQLHAVGKADRHARRRQGEIGQRDEGRVRGGTVAVLGLAPSDDRPGRQSAARRSSATAGRVTIADVPPGTATIRVWSPAILTQEIACRGR